MAKDTVSTIVLTNVKCEKCLACAQGKQTENYQSRKCGIVVSQICIKQSQRTKTTITELGRRNGLGR